MFERVTNISYLNSRARGNRNVMFTFLQCAHVKEWEGSLIHLVCNCNQRLRPSILFCIDSLSTVELDRLERYLVDICDVTNTLFITLIKNNSFHLCVVHLLYCHSFVIVVINREPFLHILLDDRRDNNNM